MSLSIDNRSTVLTSAVSSHTNTKNSLTSESSFTTALQEFYQIHQRSQITGVPTAEYNNALEKIGIDTSDTFAATKGINLLQSYGYDTNKPTDEAIVTYGKLDVSYGNKSYMQNGTSFTSDALQNEIDTLNETSHNAYEGAKNYFDIALKNVQNPSLTSSQSISSGEKTLLAITSNSVVTSESSFTIALQEFYQIHQRSQITGVPTAEYNNALEKIGIDTSDTFAASKGINLLQSYGYDTNKPTDEAIVTYGKLDVSYGNKSYMQNGTSFTSDALQNEIDTLNETSHNAYEGAKNYFDIALKNVQNPSLTSSQLTANLFDTRTNDTLKVQLPTDEFSSITTEQNLLKELLENVSST